MTQTSTRQPTQDVFELVLARSVMHSAGVDPWLIHIWWRAPQQGSRLVQIYLDGVLTDVTIDPQQREAWIFADRSRPHRVELLAISADDVESIWQARRDLLQTWTPAVRSSATVRTLRDSAWPVDGSMRVAIDGEQIDAVPLWPGTQSRIGFGSLFGLGEFGLDNATAPGLGARDAQLGWGPLGSDATAWPWSADELAPGSHTLSLQPVRADGQPFALSQTLSVQISTLPPAPSQQSINGGFVLSWTD